ncbi:MAG: pyridoxine 5'-phosphate synthase [Candidatus Gastranaerophilaceae bacterium]
MFLNININYLANLRNSIGGSEPDILRCARYCEHSGADGIIAHFFEGVVGLNSYDIKNLKKHLKSRFILKIPTLDEYQNLALDCRPDIVCIVPFSREISPKNGFNILKNQTELAKFVLPIKNNGSKICVFIEPEIDQVNSAYKIGADYVELNTTKYVESFKNGNFKDDYINIKECSILAKTLGLNVMLGSSLNYQNVSTLAEIHGVTDINVGHSVVTKAIFVGLDSAIKEMKELVNEK